MALRLAVGYNYALRLKGNSLGFSGENESGTSVSDSKKLSSPNVQNLSFQSEKSSDHLIGYNGLMLNVGLAWRI